MPKKKKLNYLKFIILILGLMITGLIFVSLDANISNKAANLLNNSDLNTNTKIISQNLISYVKDQTLISPTVSANAPYLGLANAPITIFEFSSFGCPNSREIQPILKQILAKYPNQVKLVWKDLPLPELYPQADTAHLAARCAQAQGQFWPYHDLLWQNNSNLSEENLKKIAKELQLNENDFNACLQKQSPAKLIEADISQASELAIIGTPHFYINSQEIVGSASLADFEKIIEIELNR